MKKKTVEWTRTHLAVQKTSEQEKRKSNAGSSNRIRLAGEGVLRSLSSRRPRPLRAAAALPQPWWVAAVGHKQTRKRAHPFQSGVIPLLLLRGGRVTWDSWGNQCPCRSCLAASMPSHFPHHVFLVWSGPVQNNCHWQWISSLQKFSSIATYCCSTLLILPLSWFRCRQAWSLTHILPLHYTPALNRLTVKLVATILRTGTDFWADG